LILGVLVGLTTEFREEGQSGTEEDEDRIFYLIAEGETLLL